MLIFSEPIREFVTQTWPSSRILTPICQKKRLLDRYVELTIYSHTRQLGGAFVDDSRSEDMKESARSFSWAKVLLMSNLEIGSASNG